MERVVQPELLDSLPARDSRAIGSRADLRRINQVMGSAKSIAAALKAALRMPARVLELGAGDGTVFLEVADRLPPAMDSEVSLLDQHRLVAAETERQLQDRGWRVRTIQADACAWRPEPTTFYGAIVANLFLHHFEAASLRELFSRMKASTATFIAFEPRRAFPALLFSRMVHLIGCNGVTRHDAPVSVKAGFSGQELSSLWGDAADWQLTEKRAGQFGHLFVAARAES